MEVSMPTGSLCAERNVIGTALSADITLRREDIKIVAVYAASMAPPPSTPGASALYRGSSTSSQGYGVFSKQNSLVLPGGPADEILNGSAEHDLANIHAMQSPKRSSSISFSDAPQVYPRSGPVTPNRSREGTMTGDATCYPCRDSPGLTPIDTTYSGDHYPPSQADTPVMGTPSPQHSGAFGGHGNGAKSPQLGGKRKIMSITQQLPGGQDETETVVKTARPEVSVKPSAPPAGLSRGTALTRQALSAATGNAADTASSTSNGTSASAAASNGASSTTTASSNTRRRTKTKTVAFSASSNNLAAHSPSPVDLSFLDQSDIVNSAGNAFLSSPNSSMLDLSATDLAELNATTVTLASAVKSLPNHNCPIETETITVDKE
jgi:hypothetical protein